MGRNIKIVGKTFSEKKIPIKIDVGCQQHVSIFKNIQSMFKYPHTQGVSKRSKSTVIFYLLVISSSNETKGTGVGGAAAPGFRFGIVGNLDDRNLGK